MTTAPQLSANRQNALASTGPKSPEGKAVVSQNAVRHGLTSTKFLLSNEEQPEFLSSTLGS